MDQIKIVEYSEVFQEFPDEITLAMNLSRCPNNCPGCHSSYLAGDIGEVLSIKKIKRLVKDHPGITCLGFMGGDNSPEGINQLAKEVKQEFPELKVGWYSGKDYLSEKIDIKNFDYIKIGSYKAEYGPLNKRTTNQKLWKCENGKLDQDITFKFWKDHLA